MSATTEDRRKGGVEFVHEDDGSITARDIETSVVSFGEMKAEALALHEDGGNPVTDDDLREFGLDPDDRGDRELPDFMR